jgi:hypothetical protein
MHQRCHSKLTEHVAFLARRYDFFLGIGHIDLFTLMKSLNESFVSKAVLTPSLEIYLIQKCLWILRKKFKFQTTKKNNFKHFQCLKQSLKALLEIKFPMLISVESKFATYHHVVVVWGEMVIDYESMYTYPLTEDTLRQIRGVNKYLSKNQLWVWHFIVNNLQNI